MLKIHLKYYISLLCAITFFSCKKKEKQNEEPTVNISIPSANIYLSVGDTIVIKGWASDDKEVKTVSAGITDQNYITVMPFVSQNASQSTFAFEFTYVLDEIHLETGNYYIIVQAYDGEKENRTYVPIHISASPFVKTAYLFTSHNGFQSKIEKTDTLMAIQNSVIKPGILNGAAISSYYQQFYVNGSGNQNAICYNAMPLTQKWLITNYGAGQPYFTSISSDDRYFYVGTIDGTITKYLPDGGLSTIYTYTDPSYYPTFFYKHSQFAFSVFENPVIFSKKIITHYMAGASYQEIPVNADIIGMSEKNINEAFVAMNNSLGKAEIKLLNGFTNNLSNTFVLPNAKMLSFTPVDQDNLLISLDDGNIYKYTYSNSNIISVANGTNAQYIHYDKHRNELLVLRGKTAQLYSLNGFVLNPLAANYTSADSLRGAFVLYNK
jgi:hypothetical protein